jgi:membrane protein
MDQSGSRAEPKGQNGRPPGPSPRTAPSSAIDGLLTNLREGRRDPAAAEASPRAPAAFDTAEPGRGRAASSPLAIPPLGWKDILWRTWRDAGRHRLGSLAGGVTFYLLLATFPALAAFVSIYGMFLNLGTVSRLLDQLSLVFPQDAVNLIAMEMVRLSSQKHEALSAAFLFSALASIWSANAGLKALLDGLNVAYGEVEKRPYLRRTLMAYVATLATMLFLVTVTLLTVAAPMVLHGLGLREIKFWFAPLRWLMLYLIAAGGFTIAYRHGPSRARARWRWVVCGGAGAALIWMLGSIGFSSYLNNFTHFDATYGSLGVMIGFMLWVWMSVMVVLYGAVLNAEIEHQTAQDTTVGPPLAIGRRGAIMADTLGTAFTVSPSQAHHVAREFLGRQAGHLRRAVRSLTGR